MSASILFYCILTILIVEFLLSRWLDYLNAKTWTNDVPAELSDLYDLEKYQKAQNYNKENKQLSLWVSTISIVLLLLFLWFDGFAWLHNFLGNYTTHYIALPLLFFGVLYVVSDILSLPVSLYSTFGIEAKYGFNKMTLSTFFIDKLKGYLLTAIVGGLILSILIFIYTKTGNYFWLLAWIFMTFFSLFFSTFYTSLIVPIFNKLSPLEEGDLKAAIQAYAQKVKFPLKNIFIVDGSKRSSKANAYFSGLGKSKSIVLYDTLVEKNSVNELVAVLAHEVGHYKKKHIQKSLVLSIIQTGVMLFILGYALRSPELSQALGVSEPTFHIGLIAFGILFSPISTILGLFMNQFSRKNEYEADAYAKATFNKDDLISALKRLHIDHLSNLKPHPAYVFFYYSHPTLLQRLNALNTLKPSTNQPKKLN